MGHSYIRKGRSAIALRAEVQEFTRRHPEAFFVDDKIEFVTQSESDTFEVSGC